jgi:aspartyl-tRNA(Asn)/glutamyl-tRNA(Gln) amidotransferase subunit A
MKQPINNLRLGIPRAPYFDHLDDEVARVMDEAIAVLGKLTKSTRDCYLPAVSGFSALALGGEREAYHMELFRRNSQRYSMAVRQSLESTQKQMNDTSSEACSEKVVDYVLSNWELIRMRKTIDDAFTDVDVVVLPTMRLLPRTVNDALSREEKPESREPEIDTNTVAFNLYGIPAISIPCGFSTSGLPIGLMIAGPRFSEGRILALAAAYEKATQWHTKRPKLTPDMPVPPVTRKT